jgi:hypothetical protein
MLYGLDTPAAPGYHPAPIHSAGGRNVMKRSTLLLAFLLALAPVGCVTRRVLITSNPPGAIVFRNGQPIGATPVEESFVYYGTYHYRLVREGCEPVDFFPHLAAPWYQWPGIDFVAENVIPYQFRDRRTLHFDLPETRPVHHDAIRARATELQQQGAGLHAPPGTQPPPPRPGRRGATPPPAAPSPGVP